MEHKELREKLLYSPKNGYDRISGEERRGVFKAAEAYKTFLSRAKTERDAAMAAVELAEAEGFVPYSRGMKLAPGDRVYTVNHGKSVILAVVGRDGLDAGAHILAAHIDSPRLDLKPMPMYEDKKELVYFKTHYYGGIKKYQWAAIPLELRGVVALTGGGVVNVEIGAKPGDPVFTITDLLPHLGKEQNEKKLADGISGEALNVLIGSIPMADDEGADRAKLAILAYLSEQYGIREEDFLSAELSIIPHFPVSDVGFDRSLIGGYGHDDRCCAYAAIRALFDIAGTPAKTAVCVLADKEEIGSVGVTGMQSRFFDTFMEDLCEGFGVPVRACYEASSCLSADVCNAFDPIYAEVSDPRNSAYANYGVSFMKYTGSRGKSGSNDANAELIGTLRTALDAANVVWQMSELGKVDQGGGGTVACFMGNRNISTIDIGIPVLSMHAPYEVIAKFDLYMAIRAMSAFCAIEE